MDQLIKLITEKGRDFWKSPAALVAVLLISGVGLLTIFATDQIEKIEPFEWTFITVVFALILAAWMYARRIPKSAKDKVGFGIAIEFENPKQQVSVRSDLVSRLWALLSQHNNVHQFELIEFPQHLCRKLDGEAATRLLRKSRCQFLIFGLARMREQHGKPLHVFDLAGIVSHAPITVCLGSA